MSIATHAARDPARAMTPEERKVILASSLGTVFEWYDFYLAGSLAVNISANFGPGADPTANFIFTLMGFAAGFAVRPFGALVFGRLGDLIGRKYTFLVTMTLMGVATFVVGLLPSTASIGMLAPTAFILCRLVQGLAIGGEYGGAATYVAEHSPHGRRGNYTSWIQTTATLGLFASLIVILSLRLSMTPEDFAAYGWRIPFLVSIVLLIVSVWIRLQLNESPAFQKMKDEGTLSKAPLGEAFGQWGNLKIALIALFGATAGQAVVWYTGQFYALFFLAQTLKIDGTTANLLVTFALVLGTPFFILFGTMSDKIGRKPILLSGCVLAALTFFPIFKSLGEIGNPKLMSAHENVKVILKADPATCGSVFDPVGVRKFTSPCDTIRRALATAAVKYEKADAAPGATTVVSFNGKDIPVDAAFAVDPKMAPTLAAAAVEAGYPKPGDATIFKAPSPAQVLGDERGLKIIGLLLVLLIYATMVYGPMAALLVELFPTRIRYSGMSLPYHLGNGWAGGFLPPTAFAIAASTGDIFAGLWYPIVIALITFVVGLFLLPETKDRDIFAD